MFVLTDAVFSERQRTELALLNAARQIAFLSYQQGADILSSHMVPEGKIFHSL